MAQGRENGDPRGPYLRRIVLVTARRRFRLGGPSIALPADLPDEAAQEPDAAPAARIPTLAGEAMRWTYVLRSRERWKSDAGAARRHERSAAATLHAFGLGEEPLREIARAGIVTVEMPFVSEQAGWAGRIFPWEYVIAAATRRHRSDGRRLTVMRHLRHGSPPPAPVAAPQPRVLFVQSQPGAIAARFDIDREAEVVRRAFGLGAEAGERRWRRLHSPTPAALRAAVEDFRPEVVHLAGCDNHQGARLIREHGGARSPILVGTADGDQVMTAADFLDDPGRAIDGVLLSGDGGMPRVTSPDELGAALTAGGAHQPYLVGVNTWNSAARTAPLLLVHGVLASVGIQDAFDDALAEYFFEALYGSLAPGWHLPAAFEAASLSLRGQPDLGPGTGVVLWARAPLIAARLPAAAAPPAAPAAARVEPHVRPLRELNYSVLHNQGPLFEAFELRKDEHSPTVQIDVLVELHCGSEQARYASRQAFSGARLPLVDAIRVPLTGSLLRSVSEAVQSSLFVEVRQGEEILLRNTWPLRLLPVDQWLDNERSGRWLPSFVLPRDPAVEAAISAAQRYVRVIRDDPDAGFEGYQSADPADPDSLDQVDLQVEAIWAALLHEWRLGYINPPPTYADTREGVMPLDSQRLRTPSNVRAAGMGTCIDLALLFAACLELVDIYPVVFLLDGHALPGYWRHHDFQARYREVAVPAGGEALAEGDARSNGAAGTQAVPWQVGRSGYREIRRLIRSGRLVPLETVRLTERGGFRDAIQAGIEALSDEADFDSVLDIMTARRPHNVTPLPIVGG